MSFCHFCQFRRPIIAQFGDSEFQYKDQEKVVKNEKMCSIFSTPPSLPHGFAEGREAEQLSVCEPRPGQERGGGWGVHFGG